MFAQEQRERLRSPEERVGTLVNGALPPPTDEDLLQQALIGRDDRALDLVVDRLMPSMLHVAMTHVRTRAEAEDVVQDTWLGALRGIDRFEQRSSLRTWLFRILKNRARTRGSRLARMVTFTDLEAASAPLRDASESPVDRGIDPHGVAGPERDLLSRELGERIRRAVSHLPQRQREVITMRDIDGYSAAEVRDALGLTDGNQRVLLHRARARIRDQLGDDGDGRAFRGGARSAHSGYTSGDVMARAARTPRSGGRSPAWSGRSPRQWKPMPHRPRRSLGLAA